MLIGFLCHRAAFPQKGTTTIVNFNSNQLVSIYCYLKLSLMNYLELVGNNLHRYVTTGEH